MSSISRWPRASMQAMHSRSCCSLPRMMRLSCAIVAPTSSIGSAWVMSVGTASIGDRVSGPTSLDERADDCFLLLDLGNLALEVDDARAHFGDLVRRGAVDELAVFQLRLLSVEVLLGFRLALLQAGQLCCGVVDQAREWRGDRALIDAGCCRRWQLRAGCSDVQLRDPAHRLDHVRAGGQRVLVIRVGRLR